MNELTSVYGLLCQGLTLTGRHRGVLTTCSLPDWVRGRLSQVASHEQSHVDLLSGALGNDAVQPCNYKLYVPTFSIK
jgi:hypothetical protein